ncbi:MAG TPA: ribonuclease III, partial [Anaerolineae bacterium]|nr:ribonuclease III [Anaerolineae bacterium]
MNETTKLPELADLIEQLGVAVNDHALLELALTHRSYLNENPEANADNERLEFLGDAVIDLIIGAYLFRRFPEMREGEMTSLRAALVRAETLAQFAQQLTIDQHLRLGWGEDESGGRKKIPTL